MSFSIPLAYTQGVQAKLVEDGILQYHNEKVAMEDAAQLGEALDSNLDVDRGGLATEGGSPGETKAVASALVDMAQEVSQDVGAAKAKADIVAEAVQKVASLHQDQFSKFAAAPGDNNVVAGHKPGKVAPGESSAKSTDLRKELANAVSATVERPEHWDSTPGKQKDEDKGHLGTERDHEGRNAQGGPVKDSRELVNAVSATKERANAHGGPGDQDDEDKGHVGTEKEASLSSLLARL